MDYDEEQQMELEALEAIIGDDGLQKYTGTVPSGWGEEREIYKVKLQPDTDDVGIDLSFDLLFQHTDKYPEEVPLLRVSNTRGMTDADAAKLLTVINATAEENLGMAAIFAVMQAAKDWLENKAGLEEVLDPAVVKKQQEEAEEAERAAHRALGTPVTVESFTAWRVKFDAEMAAANAQDGESTQIVETHGRMTGRQWFTEKDRPEVPEGGEYDVDLEDDDDTDFEFEDDEEDEDDFLDDYLADADEGDE